MTTTQTELGLAIGLLVCYNRVGSIGRTVEARYVMSVYEVRELETKETIGFTDKKGLDIFLQFYRQDSWEPENCWIPSEYLNFGTGNKVFVGNKIDDISVRYAQVNK